MPLTAEKTPESTCKCIIKSNQIDHYVNIACVLPICQKVHTPSH